MKNDKSLQNLQFQSLIFHKLAKQVPGNSKHVKKIIKGPLGIISCQNKYLKVKNCEMTTLVPQVWKMSKIVL